MKMKIIYGIDEMDSIILGSNTYNYSSDETIMNLIKEKKKVRLTNEIDRPLDFLPYGIEELFIGSAFNYPIDNLPASLKYLEISKYSDVGYCCFNQKLDYLPVCLEELRLYYCNNGEYEQYIDNLPSNLKILFIRNHKYFPKSAIQILGNLPESIELLHLHNYNFDCNLQILPSKLKIFEVEFKNNDSNDLNNLNIFMNKHYPHVKFNIRI